MKFIKPFYITLFLLFSVGIYSQNKKLIDGTIATVGEEVVLQSDIEDQLNQMRMQSSFIPKSQYCKVLEQVLIQKLMVNQAKLDSIVVSEDQLEMQLDQRMNYFVKGFGSEKKLEEYFNKSVTRIKEELRPVIRDQLVAQRVKSEVTGDVSVTPSEVERFYSSLSEDSIPFIESKVKLAQIVVYPELEKGAGFKAKEKLLNLRKRIVNGENFSTLAVLYSQGPSAAKKGELGYMAKGELAPEYAKAAFKLKEPGSVSNVVRTDFGYHIIQLINKKGNKVNTRHILIKPEYDPESVVKAKQQLDSLLERIRTSDTLSFTDAAKLFSQDKETGINGGVMINQKTNSNFLGFKDLEVHDYYAVKDLKVGEISKPYEAQDKTGKKLYKIIKVLEVVEPHKANLSEDYDKIAEMALMHKKQKVVGEWIADKRAKTFVEISSDYKSCPKLQEWLKK